MPYVALAARVFLSIIFLKAGISHVTGFSGFQQTIASQGGLLMVIYSGPGQLSVDAQTTI
ncbi:MAG: hypothetical protein AAF289_09200 [Cyanobacteria bacterium P01_A01_bin.135]